MPDFSGLDIGRYHTLEQIGRGGMATVYQAYDRRLDKDVAIKFIRREAFPPEIVERMLQRFEREARALARLTHANIIPIYDFDEYEGSPYLVMPFISGGTLKECLGKPMAWQKAVKLLIPVARALDYAHQRDILHRDVKPSNILINDSGDPMLSDFGVAKILEDVEGNTLTGTGTVIGTPEYMAPEQWMGKPVPQSDIYALGIMFYEMVTGQKPYQADTPMAVMIKHINDPLPRPREIAPGLPEAVEKVLFKTLSKDPKERYESAGHFASVLEGLLQSEQIIQVMKSPVVVQPSINNEEKITTTEPAESEKSPVFNKQNLKSLPKFYRGFWIWAGIVVIVSILGVMVVNNMWNNPGIKPEPSGMALVTNPIEVISNSTDRPKATSSKTPTSTKTLLPTTTLTALPSIRIEAQIRVPVANVRTGPGEMYPKMAYLPQGKTIILTGRSLDAQWALVELENNQMGWLSIITITTGSDLLSLPVVEAPTTPTPETGKPSDGSQDTRQPTVMYTIQPTNTQTPPANPSDTPTPPNGPTDTPSAPPTDTPAPPTSPTDTPAAPSTDTPAPPTSPTDTPIPPTSPPADTPLPPADTAAPPTSPTDTPAPP